MDGVVGELAPPPPVDTLDEPVAATLVGLYAYMHMRRVSQGAGPCLPA
jgi:hypothetical protein